MPGDERDKHGAVGKPVLGKQALCQLSYSRPERGKFSAAFEHSDRALTRLVVDREDPHRAPGLADSLSFCGALAHRATNVHRGGRLAAPRATTADSCSTRRRPSAGFLDVERIAPPAAVAQ